MGIGLNIDSNKILKIFKNIFWIIVIAKLLSEPLYFLLPIRLDFTFKTEDFSSPYHRYMLSKVFKIENKKETKQEIKQNAMPIDNMILKGIYESKSGGFIIVALKKSPKDEKIVGIGDEFKGYKLIKIYPKKAIFERNGKEFVLYIMGKKNQKESKYISETTTSQQISRVDIDYYTKNFKKISENIKIDEIRKNGIIKGFKIKDIKKGSIFDTIGLKVGDIIIKANDKPLRSYGDAFYFYNQIKNGKISSLKLTVLRNNKEKDIEYEIY